MSPRRLGYYISAQKLVTERLQLCPTQALLFEGMGSGKLLKQNMVSPTIGQVAVLFSKSTVVVQKLCTIPSQTLTPYIMA